MGFFSTRKPFVTTICRRCNNVCKVARIEFGRAARAKCALCGGQLDKGNKIDAPATR